MRILIIGGCGFVGRSFALKLLESDDHEITVVDNFYSGLPRDLWIAQPRYPYRLTIRQADVRTWFREKKSLPSDYDLVIHCAAVVGGRLNIDGDPLVVATDLSIDSEFFNWVVRGEFLPKVIYFSSSAAYPTELQTEKVNCLLSEPLLSFSGTRISMPDFTYGWAKLSGEYLAKIAAERYGLDVKIFRPFGGYGPDQDMTYPFPSIIKRILEKQNPIVVWGSGNQARDFIYIDDVVDCVLSTMNRLKPGEVLNIGTGRGVSFRELAEMACNILGHKAEIVSDTTKPQGVFHRVSDPYKMLKLFKPKVTLEEGIKRVATHLQKALDGAKVLV
jgi:nucleoside-diphosphate-sugar epimerase